MDRSENTVVVLAVAEVWTDQGVAKSPNRSIHVVAYYHPVKYLHKIDWSNCQRPAVGYLDEFVNCH